MSGTLLTATVLKVVLLCDVEGSDDRFLFWPHQRIQQSDTHLVYSLMGGLTVAVVDRRSGRFQRRTHLSLQSPGATDQVFRGQCKPLE